MAKDRMSEPKTAPATSTMPSVAPPTATPEVNKGRKPLSPEEKAKRAAELKLEPKDRKFRRLANHRVPRALKAISAIAHLANRSQYEYTDEQVEVILEALLKSVQTVQNKFKGNKDNGTAFHI